jgi:hypothetical protein
LAEGGDRVRKIIITGGIIISRSLIVVMQIAVSARK